MSLQRADGLEPWGSEELARRAERLRALETPRKLFWLETLCSYPKKEAGKWFRTKARSQNACDWALSQWYNWRSRRYSGRHFPFRCDRVRDNVQNNAGPGAFSLCCLNGRLQPSRYCRPCSRHKLCIAQVQIDILYVYLSMIYVRMVLLSVSLRKISFMRYPRNLSG